MLNRRVLGGFIMVAIVLAASLPAAATDIPLRNWPAPATWSPQASSGGGRTALAVTAGPPVPLIPVAPCRVMDTRVGYGQTGNFGPPTLGAGATRAISIPTHPTCTGVPITAGAYSLNLTVTNTGASGYLQVWPTGQAQPATSNLNYPGAGATLANAAVVQAGTSGQINVFSGAASADVIIDINGYYAGDLGSSAFTVSSTGGYGIIGTSSTNVGVWGRGTTHGVFGFSTTGTGDGVYGLSSAGNGVYGLTSTGVGVRGLLGSNPAGSDFPAGVAGKSAAGWGMFAKTNTGCAQVIIRANASGTDQNETDLGCSDAVAARFFGGVQISTYTGGPGNLAVAGNLAVGGALTKASGSFLIDHPLDPENKYLYHSFVESPDMKNVYDGVVELNSRGEAVVVLPGYFEALNSDFRYQLTSIGRHAPIFIADEVGGNQFRIAGGRPGMRVSWQVTGIRKDAWANAHRIVPEVEKEPEMQGRYLHPLEFGKSISKGLSQMPQSQVVQETRQ